LKFWFWCILWGVIWDIWSQLGRFHCMFNIWSFTIEQLEVLMKMTHDFTNMELLKMGTQRRMGLKVTKVSNSSSFLQNWWNIWCIWYLIPFSTKTNCKPTIIKRCIWISFFKAGVSLHQIDLYGSARGTTWSLMLIGRIPKLNHVLHMSKSVQSIREMTVVASMWHNYGIKQRQQLDCRENSRRKLCSIQWV